MNKLEIPCSYQGGKSRLAENIVDIIFKQNNINDNTKFYDLCCGSGAITIELINRGINPINITMIDKSPFALFYKSIGEGTFDLDAFKKYIDNIPSKELVKQHLEKLIKENCYIDTVYKYILLQAGSFGSKAIWIDEEKQKWCTSSFRSYWLPTETSNRRSPVNPMMPMPDTLFERVKNIHTQCKGLNVFCNDIFNVICKIHSENSIIYIDPPYKDTSQYGYGFDINRLIEKIKILNVPIYISEGYKFSDDSICLSNGRSKGGISGNRNKKANEEWLNIYNKLN